MTEAAAFVVPPPVAEGEPPVEVLPAEQATLDTLHELAQHEALIAADPASTVTITVADLLNLESAVTKMTHIADGAAAREAAADEAKAEADAAKAEAVEAKAAADQALVDAQDESARLDRVAALTAK